MKFESLKHPPYSPDVAPSDFHLVGLLKEALHGQKSSIYNEVNQLSYG
jgi:hypothetical protein